MTRRNESETIGTELHSAIDIGTHSTRLLIGTVDEGRLTEVLRRTTITKLGTGVDKTGLLNPDSVARTLDVLREYERLCLKHNVSKGRAVATSALRDATNSGDFLDQAESVLGFRPEVISGSAEANLTFSGATFDLPPWHQGHYQAVIDIGGGSTEIVIGRQGAVLTDVSLPMGCLRMTERFLSSDPPSAAEIQAIIEYGREQVAVLSDFRGEDIAAVGVAGTTTSLLAIRDSVDPYEPSRIHHKLLSLQDVKKVLDRLAGLTLEERKKVPGLQPLRADVIVAGAAILVAVMETLGLEKLLLSEADILDGVLLSTFDVRAA